MDDPKAAISQLLTAIPQLSQVPPCILPAYGAIAAAGCGPDLACICGNEKFFLTLQGVLIQGTCSPVEAQASLSSTQSVCAKAVPWLNDNRGPEIVAAISILITLATIAVILRVIARRISKLKFGMDDWLIFLALLFSYGLNISQYTAVHYGLGRHVLMLNNEQITAFTKIFFATTLVFPVSAAATKLSVLYFYHRIFPERRFRIISVIIGLVVILWFIAFVILQFVTCIPLAYYWDKTIPGGRCLNSNRVAYYGVAPGDIATNIAILILPLPYLWKLQMQWQKKVAITVILLLGGFAVIGSIVRVPFIVKLKQSDVSYTVSPSAIWLNVENNIGIISVSLPMLRPVFSKISFSTLRSRFSRSRNSHYATGSQRLPDVEKGNTGRSSTLVGSNRGGSTNNVYSGGGKGHKTWYSNAVSALGSKHEDMSSGGSQEEMVPMGQISVKRELDWESRHDASAVTPPA